MGSAAAGPWSRHHAPNGGRARAPALLWVPETVQIAYVTETYPPELNGVALTVFHMVGGLRARGHVIDLVRPLRPGEPPREDVHEWRTPGLPLPMYRGLRIGLPLVSRLVKRWTQTRPDIVHVATEGPLGWAAVRAARALGVPVTSDFRTHFELYSAYYGFAWCRSLVTAYLRRFHNATDRTFVPTATLRRDLLGQGYERVEVVARGVDGEQFSPLHRSVALRASWGATDTTPVALYVGRLAAEKNVPLAFRAYEALRARAPAARMVVVGDGPLAERLQREHPAAIFAGRRAGDDLARYYASSDIFLFPSQTDTFGNVTLEALASGLLVVAFRTGAATVHIEDCANGVLIEPGDEQGFIAGACALAQQFRWLSPMREGARRAADAASWDAVISRFESFLADVAHAVEAPLAPTCPA
jgi:glycosyltransferase involved in cell wall biosynthesis